MTNSIMIIDDDKDYLLSLKRALTIHGIKEKIYLASTEKESLQIMNENSPLVMILDLELNASRGVESGYELLQKILKKDKTCKVIILTGHTSSEYGIKAIKLGASNFLKKPANIAHLAVLINDALMQATMLREYEKLKNKSDQNNLENFIIGTSDAIKKIRDEVSFLSENNSPVLIKGESGTGKGLIAKAIHIFGKYKNAQFIRYQPNYLSNDLANSDFFGHRKGAFTGANEDKKGLLELANNGTFFLDEVALLPQEIQIALLTAMQEHKIRKIGDTKEISVNFRLISATNENIENAIENNKLRFDFYQRIAHSIIELPPLRQRIEDIKPLSIFFLNEISKKEDILINDISPHALEKLKSYSFKGNIRELESIIQVSAYKANFHNRQIIEKDDISFLSEKNVLANTSNSIEQSLVYNSSLTFKEKIDSFKKLLITNELKRNNNNQTLTAKQLGIDRTTLIRILGK